MLASTDKITRCDDPALVEALRRRVADSPNLCAFFAGLVWTTGRLTTARDAFNAHMSWVEDQRATFEFTFDDLTDLKWYESAAFQVREIARQPAGI